MKEKYDVFLIDSEGNKVSSDTIDFHLGLAKLVLEKDEKLKREYEKLQKEYEEQSRVFDESLFLLTKKGYMEGIEIGEQYKKITYYSKLISEKQRNIIEYYRNKKAKLYDLAEDEQKMERGEL